VKDWILSEDGIYGQVVLQTPETVQVRQPGGSLLVVATSSFLGSRHRNLSKGFRSYLSFGIDYEHQADVIDTIPQKLHPLIESYIAQFDFSEHLEHLEVDFESAQGSSLNFAIIADFSGSAAPFLRKIERVVQQACVAACNQEKWGIPFTQITVHTPAAVANG
jgi:small-conductance mechanosensitive channel